MGKGEVRERLEKARAHVEFVIGLYLFQLARGARFLRERPATAASWGLQEMRKLLSEPQVSTAIGHLCRFGARVSEP
eukprot:15305807-Alexandrium_andersonii.AAC.1